MSFIAKNPLTVPVVESSPSVPLTGTRGLFAGRDGWYDVDSNDNTRKIATDDDTKNKEDIQNKIPGGAKPITEAYADNMGMVNNSTYPSMKYLAESLEQFRSEISDRSETSGVGEAIENGGEIFNDYENNKAVSEYSHASGSNTHAGHYAFSFKEHEYTEADYDTTNNIGKYYLNTVEGITVGLNYTIVLNNNFGYQGVVNSVGEDYIEVTNYLVPNSDSTKTIYLDSSYIIFPDKPAIQGDMLIGYAAHSEGYSTNAMGTSSHAEGGSTIASGQYSHAEGRGSKAGGYASHAETSGQALGHGSHAESLSIAKGEYSHGEGRSSAIGNQSHAEGQNTVAEGANSHAEGYNTSASGENAHAEGKGTYANSEASHAEGSGTVAEGIISHAEGKDTRAIGNQSHVEGTGSNTTINGQHGHAEGYCSSVDALGAHAEGYRTVASGKYAHAEGSGTTAQGYASHAEGYNTGALGENAHAEGSYTNATSSTSHAEGQSCLAAGKASHAEGLFAKAHGEAQHVQGRYNIEDTENKYAHIVGNGTSVTGEDGKEIRTLSNAHTLDWEGNAWFAGDVKAGDVSVQALKTRIDELENQLNTALDTIIALQNSLIGGDSE